MKIVGVGCGPLQITLQAVAVLTEAEVIYGSSRALALAAPYIKPGCDIHTITDYRSLTSPGPETVIVSTGDPMLAGLGYLDGDVIPGISSLCYAAAKLHIRIQNIIVVNAHGRDHTTAIRTAIVELQRNKIIFLLADPAFDTTTLAKNIQSAGLFCEIIICEALGYPEEKFIRGTSESSPIPDNELFSIIISQKE
ncbi:MAG: cobalt-precorrin-7 (C(5))-methyltransferase [Methanospirillaceae archaeon]|nr:cobalt-precorrin-7 (C(5))-methyltransferase [Methanospirillaceae archaeon]